MAMSYYFLVFQSEIITAPAKWNGGTVFVDMIFNRCHGKMEFYVHMKNVCVWKCWTRYAEERTVDCDFKWDSAYFHIISLLFSLSRAIINSRWYRFSFERKYLNRTITIQMEIEAAKIYIFGWQNKEINKIFSVGGGTSNIKIDFLVVCLYIYLILVHAKGVLCVFSGVI